jgi:hypothetical protein
VTLLTLTFVPEPDASAATRANSSSFPAVVENEGDLIVVLAAGPSPDTFTSMLGEVAGAAAWAVKFTPVTSPPLIVGDRLTGAKVNPVLVGVTVYEPLTRLGKV